MPQPRIHRSDAERAAAYRERKRAARAAELQAKGLPAVPSIPTMPGKARWLAALNMAHGLIEQVKQEMDEYAGERSERWQESAAGEDHNGWSDFVQEALDAIEQAANTG